MIRCLSVLFLITFLSVPTFAQKGSHEKWGIPKKKNDGIIIRRTEFVYSVNKITGFSNWVLQRLGIDDYGNVKRWSGPFYKDSLLPIDLPRPSNSDFENSGYDKGHAVRSEERTFTVESNRQTFVMSNIFPQTHELNIGPWANFERWSEKMCKDSTYEFWIVIGPIYEGESVFLNKKTNHYLVPQYFYKVFVYKKKIGNPQTMAILMRNDSTFKTNDWKNYVVPISKIEKLTGYKFFPKIK